MGLIDDQINASCVTLDNLESSCPGQKESESEVIQ